jgi:lysophospholipase L1-like esterase
MLVSALTLGCTGPSTASAGPPKHLNYVAMGDSAAAAPGVPEALLPYGCGRSTNNYPSVLARRIAAASFTDVTCSGAATGDITSHSLQTFDAAVPPQMDSLPSDTTLITITVGANDVGVDAGQCRAASLNSPPCVDKFVVGGVDRISGAIAAQLPVWGALIDAVRAKAPAARIVLVGYLSFIRPGGCYPEEPVLPQDATYLESKFNELGDRQKQLAVDKGIDYFDTRPLSVGRDMCAPPDQRYVEGFAAVNPGAPLHPNARGVAAVGNALADYLG